MKKKSRVSGVGFAVLLAMVAGLILSLPEPHELNFSWPLLMLKAAVILLSLGLGVWSSLALMKAKKWAFMLLTAVATLVLGVNIIPHSVALVVISADFIRQNPVFLFHLGDYSDNKIGLIAQLYGVMLLPIFVVILSHLRKSNRYLQESKRLKQEIYRSDLTGDSQRLSLAEDDDEEFENASKRLLLIK